MLPIHNLVRLPIMSLVAEPQIAQKQETIEFANVKSNRLSVEVIPSTRNMAGW